MYVIYRVYSAMAMLPMKQGLRRAVLYGGIEKNGLQVIAVSTNNPISKFKSY